MTINHRNEYMQKTFRLSCEAIDILDDIAQEFSRRLGTQMSLNKLLDTLIKHCRDVTFAEIVNKNASNLEREESESSNNRN